MTSDPARKSEASQLAAIDGESYRYDVDVDGLYRFAVDGRDCVFRQWSWGEKNRAVDSATLADPATGELRIDLARFNELMLDRCLVAAEGFPEVSVEALRAITPAFGDRLLAIAYWINELPEESKKKAAAGARRR